MLKKVSAYLLFLLRSKNQHGIHSPFVYDFVTKCLYQKYDKSEFQLFVKNRKDLLKNHNRIIVEDFGAGSKTFKGASRKVSDIAKVAGASKTKGKLLLKVVSYFSSNRILEIGTSLGIGTVALALENKKGTITTVEGCKNTASIAQHQFSKMKLNNIELIQANFDQALENITKNTTFDLIYFDGNHTKEATLRYFNTCLGSINNNSVFLFDDIYWSSEMTACWNDIKNHPLVTVTIDTYYMGFVFFRKEQAKEHFIVRL